MKDLAEKVLLGIINAGYCGEPNELAKQAYDIAAAMQAEADKRKPKPELPSLQQTFIDGVEQPRYAPGSEEWQPDFVPTEILKHDAWRKSWQGENIKPSLEWQPDWSQAPSRMNYYFVNRDGGEYWTVNKPDEPNMTEHVIDFRDCGGDCYAFASSQDYQGNWQDSLRKRPQ